MLSDFAVTVAKRDKAFKALEGALQRLLDAGDFTAAERARKRESDALSGLTEQLESTAGRVGPEASARGVDALLALEQQKEELGLSLFDRKVEFVRAKTDPQKIEKELGADSRRLRDLQRQSAAGLVKLAE